MPSAMHVVPKILDLIFLEAVQSARGSYAYFRMQNCGANQCFTFLNLLFPFTNLYLFHMNLYFEVNHNQPSLLMNTQFNRDMK